MGTPKVKIGSLSGMHSAITEKKKGVGAASQREKPIPLKSANYTREESDSDSESSSSGSDSDSDGDLDAARAKMLASQVTSKNKAAQLNSNSKKATPAKSATHTTKPATAKSAKSVYDFESDSSSSTSGDDSSSQAANQKKAQKSESESDSSESDSDEEDAAGAKVDPKGQIAAAKSSAKTSESSSEDTEDDEGSESDDSSGSEESSSSGSSDEDEPAPSKSLKSKGNTQANGDSTAVDPVDNVEAGAESTNQVSRLMLNGSDFMLRKASSDNPGKEVAEFFSNANLEGKQLWYFTAPASLPITVLKDMEIDLAKAANGKPILNYKGDAYGIDLEANATSTQISLLIPSKSGDKYTTPHHGVESTIHLRRSAKFGPGNEVSATATNGYTPIPKTIRQQPKGLKARFTPFGVPTPAPATLPQVSVSLGTLLPNSKIAPKPSDKSLESSSGSDESESSSDEEMAGTSTIPSKPSNSANTNGKLKRKHSAGKEGQTSSANATPRTDEKPPKRAKIANTTDIGKTKFTKSTHSSQNTPYQAPKSTPQQASSKSKSKEKKDSKRSKDKAPIKAPKTPSKPTPSKQTPVPLPNHPLMKR